MTNKKIQEFEVVTDELNRAVRWASKVTQSRDYANIAVHISNGVMTLSATNGVNSSKSKSEVTQKFDGDLDFSVDGTFLANATKSIKDSTIKCTLEGGKKLTIKSSRAKFSHEVTIPRNKLVLPPLPPPLGRVEAKDFRTLMNHAISMTSDDPSTPVLMTVRVEFSMQNKEVRMMATDRYKMVMRKMSFIPDPNTHDTEDFGVDVDAKSFKTLLSDLSDDDIITLYATGVEETRQFGIATSTQIGMVSLKDVKPINYGNFLRMSNSHNIMFKRSDLVQAIALTKPLMGSVKTAEIAIDGTDMSLKTEMTDVEVELVSTELPEPMSIWVSLDIVSPILSAGKSSTLCFNIENSGKPVIVRELNEDGSFNTDYFSLFMPMRSPH
ncbi:MAG: hypothetical protein H9W81_07395 [Enterococcus sp.]|nr:hypothetical protein [Enterococcus sp.]